MFKSFLSNKSGATAIEYALIASLIGDRHHRRRHRPRHPPEPGILRKSAPRSSKSSRASARPRAGSTRQRRSGARPTASQEPRGAMALAGFLFKHSSAVNAARTIRESQAEISLLRLTYSSAGTTFIFGEVACARE